MSAIAIVIANAEYDSQSNLPCCIDDAKAIYSLLESTGRFDLIKEVTNASGDAMRSAIRKALKSDDSYEEILYYFSGHGAHIGGEFYYCGSGFDAKRPNETGLSHTQLHEMLRTAEPALLTKIIDACSSGTLLVKAERDDIPLKKEGFQNVVQFSSSLEDQNSFGGDPLSDFTRAFCEATLRKEEGPVFYSDIVNILRDEYMDNDEQTPFFVSQGPGRDLLVDDATKLEGFREAYKKQWAVSTEDAGAETGEEQGAALVTQALSPLELLASNEGKLGGLDDAKALIDRLFDAVPVQFDGGKYGEFFEVEIEEYSYYREPNAEEFMIRVLSREKRSDNLVTATSRRVKKKPRNALEQFSALTSHMNFMNPEWTNEYDLSLNCTLARAQLCITLKPKYRSLQQLKLVLSIAPSFERCYVFELLTQHPYTDWDEFDVEGDEKVRRWYTVNWDEDPKWVTNDICEALDDTVGEHIQTIAGRLNED